MKFDLWFNEDERLIIQLNGFYWLMSTRVKHYLHICKEYELNMMHQYPEAVE